MIPDHETPDAGGKLEFGQTPRVGATTVFEMSVPRERLDQLLSGYLDDVLSEAEKKQVDTLLRDDPEVARELEELRRLRGSLRDISRTDSNVRLDDGFADRVLGAAVFQAQAEGVGDHHPLVKLSEQPSTTTKRRLPWIRIAGGIVALAASIAVAIVTFQSTDNDDLVAANPDTEAETLRIADLPNVDVPDPIAVDPATPDKTNTGTPHVEDSPGVQDAIVMSDGSANADPEAPISSDTISSDTVASSQGSESQGSESSLMAANPLPRKTSPEIADVESHEPSIDVQGFSNVFVINVKRTEAGRQSRVVRSSMKMASIKAAEEKELTNEMAGFVGKELVAKGQADESVQVIYLEASTKRIDVLVNRLMVEEEVESLGFGMSVSAPVRRIVESIKPAHATAVRHDTTWNLQGEAVVSLAEELGNQLYIPMKRGNGLPLTMPANSDGADQLSQVLILIR